MGHSFVFEGLDSKGDQHSWRLVCRPYMCRSLHPPALMCDSLHHRCMKAAAAMADYTGSVGVVELSLCCHFQTDSLLTADYSG